MTALKQIVKTSKAPAAIGPYSQGIGVSASSKFFYFSGQIPLDPVSGQVVPGDIRAQAKRVMDNIGGLLEAIDSNFSDIIKTTIFLKSMGDFASVNEIYSSYFTADPPARSTVAVAGLPKDVSIEIEVIVAK
jgi:2-iminobutanoate/2-iminopropanoate deaminase